MNLSQLYYFKKLAQLQHYTKAAQELFITQPTLSGAVSSLENELGVALFQKTGRNVELTKYGKEFLIYVNTSLEYLEKGIAIMKGYAGESNGGVINLACIITVQTDYLPKLLNHYRLKEKTNDIFDVSQKPSQLLIEGLKSGNHDVVFCAKGEEDTGIVYVPITAQKVVVAMNPASPFVAKEYLLPEDLQAHSLISYRSTIPLGRSIKQLLDGFGLSDVKYVYDDESILAGFAVNGFDVAIMLDTFFLKNVEHIETRPLYNNAKEKKSYYHCIYMAYSMKQYHPYCVEHFITHMTHYHLLDKSDPDKIFID